MGKKHKSVLLHTQRHPKRIGSGGNIRGALGTVNKFFSLFGRNAGESPRAVKFPPFPGTLIGIIVMLDEPVV
jgi:hypothetical protein